MDKINHDKYRLWRKKHNVPSNSTLKRWALKCDYNKDWYKQSGNIVKKYFGDNADLFIQILSATSPRNSVSANVLFALRAYNNIIRGYEVHRVEQPKYGIAHKIVVSNLEKIVRDGHLSGRKVQNFADALSGKENSVVVDVWMCRVFNIDKKAPCKSDYDFIEYTIRTIAKNIGWSACQVQASLWTYVKKVYTSTNNRQAKDFSYYLNKLTLQGELFG